MAGFVIYTLRADAETIRDTNVQNNNSTELVGKWCVDCSTYIGATTGRIMTVANQVRRETVTSGNTAYRMGEWCNLALDFVGERSSKRPLYKDLRLRANIIQAEYRDQANERRLGAWFYDFLLYIDYEGDSSIDVFWILTYELTANQTIGLPLGYLAGTTERLGFTIQVDWGDGGDVQTITYAPNEVPPTTGIPHTYTSAGTYQIYILGGDNAQNITNFRYAQSGVLGRNFLVRIDQIGTSLPGLRWVSFGQCLNLREIGYQPTYANTFPNVTSFSGLFINAKINSVPWNFFTGINSNLSFDLSSLFYLCPNLPTVDVRLFEPFINVTAVNGMFDTCRGLEYIPSGLFKNVVNGLGEPRNGFATMFYGCSRLTSVPADLFTKFYNALTAGNTFTNCTSLTSIPETLFSSLTECTTFNGTFSGSGLLSIPPALFSNCTKVNDFNSCFYNTKITAIPAGLFSNCPNVTTFYQTFSLCRNLNTVGENLYRDKSSLTTIYASFEGCISLSQLPAMLLGDCPSLTNASRAFKDTGLTEIPFTLFQGCPAITNLSYCFSGTEISAIPENIFINCVNVSNMSVCFLSCSSLTSIPIGIFQPMKNTLTNLSGTFQDCTALRAIPQGQMTEGLTRVTDCSYIFSNCTGIYGAIITTFFQNLTSCTNISNCIAYCSNTLGLSGGLFSGMTQVRNIGGLFEGWGSGNPGYNQAIPVELFKDFGSVTRVASLFSNANLKNINFLGSTETHEGIAALLEPLSSATNASSMFLNATIGNLPINALAGLTSLTDATWMFNNAKIGLTTASNVLAPMVIGNLPNVTNVSRMFYNFPSDNPSLITSYVIEGVLFPKSVNNFTECFSVGSVLGAKMTGSSPRIPDGYKLWERAGKEGYPATITSRQCFYNNTGLFDYADIPTTWK